MPSTLRIQFHAPARPHRPLTLRASHRPAAAQRDAAFSRSGSSYSSTLHSEAMAAVDAEGQHSDALQPLTSSPSTHAQMVALGDSLGRPSPPPRATVMLRHMSSTQMRLVHTLADALGCVAMTPN